MTKEKIEDMWRAISGSKPDSEDVQKLNDLADTAGIDDKDTMFILLSLLQAHFKAFSGMRDGIESAQYTLDMLFKKRVKEAVQTAVQGIEETQTKARLLWCATMVIFLALVGGAGFGAYKIGVADGPPRPAHASAFKEAVRACLTAKGQVHIADDGRIACFPPKEEQGWFLE